MRRAPRIHLASLGCAKNLVDSERLLARLALAGGLVGAPADEADVIIVNTCGFIDAARRESLDVIRELSAFKQADPTRRILVVGCLVERDRLALRAELPFVDGLFGLGEEEAIVAACGLAPAEDDGARLLLTPPHTAYLRISEGCDNRCTYCTIPLIRGPFRSRAPETILREAQELTASGARELVLIGQDTTAYGSDFETPYPIDRLLREIAAVDSVRWLRLLYTHPAHFPDGLVDAFAEIPALCPYVDLPLQHLNDEILRRMGRRTTRAAAIELIERLRAGSPGIAVRTTFIVGFPGETEAQFDELLSLVADLRFDHLGAFPFSPEPETPAAGFPEQIPENERCRRVDALMRVQQAIALDANRRRIGDCIAAVIDAPTDDPELWIGRTEIQAPDVDGVTYIRGSGLRAGAFVDVQIVDVNGYDLVARAEQPASG